MRVEEKMTLNPLNSFLTARGLVRKNTQTGSFPEENSPRDAFPKETSKQELLEEASVEFKQAHRKGTSDGDTEKPSPCLTQAS